MDMDFKLTVIVKLGWKIVFLENVFSDMTVLRV